MRHRVLVSLLFALCIVSGLTSCSPVASNVGGATGVKAGMEGQITEVHQADQQGQATGLLGAVTVEGKMQEGAQAATVSVAVAKDTRLLQQEGQSRQPIAFEALAVGQNVQVTFRGPIAETYPMQATAEEIVVVQ